MTVALASWSDHAYNIGRLQSSCQRLWLLSGSWVLENVRVFTGSTQTDKRTWCPPPRRLPTGRVPSGLSSHPALPPVSTPSNFFPWHFSSRYPLLWFVTLTAVPPPRPQKRAASPRFTSSTTILRYGPPATQWNSTSPGTNVCLMQHRTTRLLRSQPRLPVCDRTKRTLSHSTGRNMVYRTPPLDGRGPATISYICRQHANSDNRHQDHGYKYIHGTRSGRIPPTKESRTRRARNEQ
ncbi:hypothetical protein C8Q77DRAFT_581539 [Trametes polyzona]|nr:hypothetical protein C8Q77DRAFT_581539 [Trametes polyzona]